MVIKIKIIIIIALNIDFVKSWVITTSNLFTYWEDIN